jgi:uncharacterized protein
MLVVKIHKSYDGKKVLAICDEKLLGKKIEEGNKQLDLTSSFYQGSSMSNEKLEKELFGGYHLNLVGSETIAFFKKKGLIKNENIIVIGGVPHAEGIVLGD